jgi:NAD(P)-dependent dehydrogenase (short-subunit alcohol dehydrogenase family)
MPADVFAARTALVTGATRGIGYETARRLLLAGATVVLHARTPVGAMTCIERLAEGGADVRLAKVAVADFGDLGQVAQMADEVAAAYPALDLLVNNAAMAGPARRTLTSAGHEVTWQVNYLAHFLLTRTLAGPLAAAHGSRVVNVSSSLHRRGRIAWRDPSRPRRYSGLAAYAQSQLALTVFAKALADRGQTAVSLHPGTIATRMLPLYGHRGHPVGEGAAAVLNLCHPGHPVDSGAYYDHLTAIRPGRAALEHDAARRLWDLSSELLSGV